MMGHRGVRLGVTFPEITEMQVRAILEAAVELRQAGKKCFPEILVPVTCANAELDDQLEIAKAVHAEVCQKYKVDEVERWLEQYRRVDGYGFLASRDREGG